MIWIISGVALLVMLAVLAMSPEQLLLISAPLSGNKSTTQLIEQWTTLTHTVLLLLLLVMVLITIIWVIKWLNSLNSQQSANFKIPKTSQLNASKSSNNSLSNHRHKPSSSNISSIEPVPSASYDLLLATPLYVLKQQGLWRLLGKFVVAFLILLVVLSHSVTQRLQMVLTVPNANQSVYIEAWVEPIGLSDKILSTNLNALDDEELQTKTNRVEVIEGYRQLVRLTDITIFNQPSFNQASFNKQATKNSTKTVASNPFSSLDAISIETDASIEDKQYTDSLSSNNLQRQLPQKMVVMLSNYRLKHTALNELAPNQRLKMRLKLTAIKPNPPVKQSNQPKTFDEYRWLMSRHAVAKASVLEIVVPKKVETESVVAKNIKLNNLDDKDTIEINTIEPDVDNTDSIAKPTFRQRIDQQRFEFRRHFLTLMDDTLADRSLSTLRTSDSASDIPIQYQAIDDANHNQRNHHYQQAQAVTLSLLTGDRALINKDTTRVYRFAGISHLLAISGTHVLFLAILIASMVLAIINRINPWLYGRIPRWQIGFVVGAAMAFLYALFAGFDVPAARTAWMLVLVGLCRYFLSSPSIYKLLLLLALAMALQDVFILWQAGFWLSFVAVIVLVAYAQRWGDRSKQYSQNERRHAKGRARNIDVRTNSNGLSLKTGTRWHQWQALFADFFKLQLWMTLALLPISLWLFGEVSVWGVLVNLFAIALFGWVIVPINLLAGLLYLVTDITIPLANLLWKLLFWGLYQFHQLLYVLQDTASQTSWLSGWIYSQLSLPILLLILLAVIPWLLPKAALSRYLSLPAVIGLLLLPLSSSFGLNLLPINQTKLGGSTNDAKLNIIPLSMYAANNVKLDIAANLVQTQFTLNADAQTWLLLSTYTNQGYFNNHKDSADKLTYEDSKRLANILRQQLQKNDVDKLTGIVVQTATPQASQIIALLRAQIPILNYWQAGIRPSQSSTLQNVIASNMEGTGLTAQGCYAGKFSEIERKTLRLNALTGWPQIEDEAVWDCTIGIQTELPIVVVSQSGKPSLKFNSPNLNDAVEVPENPNSSNLNMLNSAVFFNSKSQKLSQLWSLMCSDTNLGLTTQYDNPSSTGDKMNLNRQFNPYGQHWLLTPQAVLSNDAIDTLAPKTWNWLLIDKKSPSKIAKEQQLYLQQRYKSIE